MNAIARTEDADALWRDLRARVSAFVRSRVAAEDADDVVQDVFLRMHVGLAAGRRIERPESYVVRVARNAVADHHRRRRPVSDGDAEALPAEQDDGLDALRADLAGCMRPFVERLEPTYREALVLTDLEGVSQAEAARRLGVSASGMRTRVQRGRKHLRDLLEACCRIEVDRRGGVVGVEPRCCGPAC